jgi:hypothetical protein
MLCQCDFFKGPFDDSRSRCGSLATKFFRNNTPLSAKQVYYARCGAHLYLMERTSSFESLTREEYMVAEVMES